MAKIKSTKKKDYKLKGFFNMDLRVFAIIMIGLVGVGGFFAYRAYAVALTDRYYIYAESFDRQPGYAGDYTKKIVDGSGKFPVTAWEVGVNKSILEFKIDTRWNGTHEICAWGKITGEYYGVRRWPVVRLKDYRGVRNTVLLNRGPGFNADNYNGYYCGSIYIGNIVNEGLYFMFPRDSQPANIRAVSFQLHGA